MNYFEVKVKYEKVQEDGKEKKVTESYLVDALSFTECEKRIIEEMKLFISGEFEVYSIARTKYEDIVEKGTNSDIRWYKTKLVDSLFDDNGKEKLVAHYLLVEGTEGVGSIWGDIADKDTNWGFFGGLIRICTEGLREDLMVEEERSLEKEAGEVVKLYKSILPEETQRELI